MLLPISCITGHPKGLNVGTGLASSPPSCLYPSLHFLPSFLTLFFTPSFFSYSFIPLYLPSHPLSFSLFFSILSLSFFLFPLSFPPSYIPFRWKHLVFWFCTVKNIVFPKLFFLCSSYLSLGSLFIWEIIKLGFYLYNDHSPTGCCTSPKYFLFPRNYHFFNCFLFLKFLFNCKCYTPFTVITQYWLYSPCSTIYPWAYLAANSLYFPIPHPSISHLLLLPTGHH